MKVMMINTRKAKFVAFEKIRKGVLGYNIECVVNAYRIKNRPEFYYKGKIPGSPTQYSDHFINWMIKELSKDNEFFAKARQKIKRIQQR